MAKITHIEFIDEEAFESKERAREVMRYIHVLEPIGNQDFTLCGIAQEGDGYGSLPEPTIKTNKKITCPDCIKIIQFCKTIELT